MASRGQEILSSKKIQSKAVVKPALSCYIFTPPRVTEMSFKQSQPLLSTAAVLITEEQKRAFTISAFRAMYKRKVTCAKLSHHAEPLWGLKIQQVKKDQQPNIPHWLPPPYLVTESTDLHDVLGFVSSPTTKKIPQLYYTLSKLH